MRLLLLLIVFILIMAFWPHVAQFTGGRDRIKNLEKSPRTKSEARAIEVLEKLTGKKFPTVHPDFMRYKGKRLELDGYNAEMGVAIEFSGPMHTKWYPAKESYEKYLARIETDKIKRQLCEARGVLLIVVDMRLPVHLYRDYFLSRLYDGKKIKERPDNYLQDQIFEPFIR